MKKMLKATGRGMILLGMLIALAPADAPAPGDALMRKLTVKSFLDFGHLVEGHNSYVQSGQNPDISMLALNRMNVIAIQDVSLNRFDVSVGLAALVWWPYGSVQTDASERVMNVKPMVPVARARWQFGDPGSIAGSLQVGTFNYKYNSDAKNLGEYLYRSGTYPGFLWSNEGWLLMNRAGNYSHGLLLSLAQMGGKLKHNFSLFMETNYLPVGDFSPGYDFSLTTKWLEIGGGAVFNHYLPIRPSLLTPKNPDNTYVHYRVETLDSLGAPFDTVDYRGRPAENIIAGNVIDTLETSHWTFKGIKVMGRAALNLGHLLPESIRGPEDLRLFVETALLGVEDQPLYYEKKSERMPIMAGITLPTAKLLDILSVQVEQYKSPFNDIELYNTDSYPIWEFAKDSLGTDLFTIDPVNGKVIPKAIHRDDFKWSVYAKKTINKVMTVYAQAASDHFRLTDGKFKASSVPLTRFPSEWYYLFRLEFSLR